MLCDECGAREANVNFTVLFEGKRINKRLCPACARKFQRGDALSALLAVLNSFDENARARVAPCPVCGQTAEQLVKTGRMGCAACYDAFEPLTATALRLLDGAGARAQTEEKQLGEQEKRLMELRAALQNAVTEERYERAAELRDEIRRVSGEATA